MAASQRIFGSFRFGGHLLLLLIFGLMSGLVIGAICSEALQETVSPKTQRDLLHYFLGVAIGCCIGLFQRHRYRRLGLLPVGLTLYSTAWILGLAGLFRSGVSFFIGLGMGLAGITFLRQSVSDFRPAATVPKRMARMLPALLLGVAALPMALGGIRYVHSDLELEIVNAVAACVAWVLYTRPVFELFLEPLIWPLYRIRGYGLGVARFPRHGPVLVVANHAAWLDPLFLAKVLPRPITPMMISVFFDKPVLRWLMVHVVRAIRVEQSAYRREAPELEEAVRRLDRGEMVVIFPEGRMRRDEEHPLRQFGQGVWHILSQRPETPVVTCWIEGNWGCYFSYFNGPPTKSKKWDWRRRIDVAVSEPRLVDPTMLADQRATRTELMQWVLDTRRLLGLAPTAHAATEEEAAV
jgi:1-acyl-sn-glycerol-3-phosphate acyltransferase